MASRIIDASHQKILVLDGATGTYLQSRHLTELDYQGDVTKGLPKQRGNHDMLVFTRPDVVTDMHNAYLAAGADIVSTNTFNSTAISQADYGAVHLVSEMNRRAGVLARAAADEWTKKTPEKPRFVAGSIGPTNRTLSLSRDVENPAARTISFDDLEAAYAEQISELINSGVDVLLVETIFDTLNARAAIHAADRICTALGRDIPVMISGTVTDKSGRTLSGQTVEAFAASMKNRLVMSIGLNCSFGAKDLIPHMKKLSAVTNSLTSMHPNAGLPDAFGNYVEGPRETAALVKELVQGGYLNIIGGCCGTTPAHIEAISQVAAGMPVRVPPVLAQEMVLAGLEPVHVSKEINFFNIGERTNVAGSKKFARLIREKKYAEALTIARGQVEEGAQMVDVNLDDGLLDVKTEMVHFLRLIASEPDICRVPVMVDSSDWDVLIAGIKAIQGKCVANSISLKSGEEKFIEQASTLKRLGAAAVFMAFDEAGQADTFERKVEVCSRMYRILTEIVAFPAEDIIFDPNILAIATGMAEHDAYGMDFIRATRWIKDNLPHAKVSGGVSNLSFSFRGNNTLREAMHAVFLYHAVQAGMDMGIVNPGMLQPYEEVEPSLRKLCEDVVLNSDAEASTRLLTFAETMQQAEPGVEVVQKAAWRELPVEERLVHALVKGLDEHVEADVLEALPHQPSAVMLIEQVLMTGMKQVGDLFAEGKMFLPQVIRSARVMKKAVAVLLPFIEQENAGKASTKSGKILLATVAGDVHDIGKNIVGVVLSCNNFETRDLGVMVPREQIVAEAIAWGADIIGVSGLITPSLEEMKQIAIHMQDEGLNIPLLIGGAATSKAHTALKILPYYQNGVVHCLDASKSVEVASILMDPARKTDYLHALETEYIDLAGRVEKLAPPLIDIETARKTKIQTSWQDAKIMKPNKLGITEFLDMPIAILRQYIHWTFFLKAWELSASEETFRAQPEKKEEAERLIGEANRMLDILSAIQTAKKDAKVSQSSSHVKKPNDQDSQMGSQALKHNEVFGDGICINGLVGLYPAASRNEDVELYAISGASDDRLATVHFPRQLEARLSEHGSLADFIAPKESGLKDYMGLFAVTAGIGADEIASRMQAQGDDFSAILLKVLCDRLAEAAAEYMHHEVRIRIWGYDPTENLPMDDMFKEKYRGIRPAPGYPAIPEHALKRTIIDVLDATERIGMTLTDSHMMVPAASVSGFYLAAPNARYVDCRHGQ